MLERLPLNFARRFVAGESSRSIKSDPQFIAMRRTCFKPRIEQRRRSHEVSLLMKNCILTGWNGAGRSRVSDLKHWHVSGFAQCMVGSRSAATD